jgi:hypothetical protein
MSVISLTPNEDKDVKEFKLKHCSCKNKSLKSGHYSYILTPTGFGYVLEITCNCCGEIKNITDYNNW